MLSILRQNKAPKPYLTCYLKLPRGMPRLSSIQNRLFFLVMSAVLCKKVLLNLGFEAFGRALVPSVHRSVP